MRSEFDKFFRLDYTKHQIEDVVNSFNLSVVSVNLISAALIVFLLFGHVTNTFLLIWLLFQFFIIALRVFYGKKLKQELLEDKKESIASVLQRYCVIIAFSGLQWGIIVCVSIVYAPENLVLFLLTFILGFSAGSVMTLGSVFLTVFLFNVPMIVSTIIALLLKEYNLLFFFEAFLLSIFLFVTLRTSYKKQKLSFNSESNLVLVKQYEEITNTSGIISKTDLKGIITHVNDNFCMISGYTKEELLGKSHNIIRHPDMPKSTFEAMWYTIKHEKKTWQGIIKNRAKNGEPYYLNATVSPILDNEGNVKEYIGLRYDISSVMSDKKQLFDYLEANKLSVLIMIQIEDYNILEKFYDKATVAEIEKVFGDAILYLMPSLCGFQRVYHLDNGLYALAKDRRTCQKTQSEIEEGLRTFLTNVKGYVVKLDDVVYDISAVCSFTYGVIQIYEDAKIGIEKAIEKKQDIIYADGFSGIEYAIALNNIETLRTLRIALDKNNLISYFQPIVNNHTRQVEKYESLVRLVDENGVIQSPAKFLEIAKKGRYYTQITKTVLENSFKVLEETDKEISINLSALDIESEAIQKSIVHLLQLHKEDAKRVVFELLESEDVKDFNAVIQFIKQVKPLGVKIAIDDFGTGYSNFQRLLQYEPDLLKIDGSLIQDIMTNELSRNIVETIVLFAQKQKIKTVAEFVENEEIFNIVKEIGIDYSQGYAFGKPEEYLQAD
jgi:PAS domain S-box-containing protein